MRTEVEEANGGKQVGAHRFIDVTDKPMPMIQASRPVSVRNRPGGGFAERHASVKPPYRVPSMDEIRAVEPCGLNLVSTFSGCGGTCLGFRMEGYRVLWASEFVPAARETYLANCDPATVVDARDIRLVQPAEILAATGGAEVDVLEGSPPCASFSTAGKRAAGWGRVVNYSDTKQRVDDLFLEFARLLDGLRPRAFAAENVSGLVKGVAKGWFLDVLAALKRPGYRVKARMLDAQWLGVPQARQRVFFVGMREDLGLEPEHPRPLPHRYSLRDACPWIIRAKRQDAEIDGPAPTVMQHGNLHTYSELAVVETEADISRFAVGRDAASIREGGHSAKYINLQRAHRGRPCPTITVPAGRTSAATVIHPTEVRKFTIAELKRICSFPDDFVLTGTYAQQWERLGRSVPPLMARAVAASLKRQLLAVK